MPEPINRTASASSEDPSLFPTVTHLPETIIPSLNDSLGSQLKGKAGIFEVGEIRIRIGKDVFGWELSG